jgi:hypothetical protein
MSSLWTPSGEHFPKKEGDGETPAGAPGDVGGDPGGRGSGRGAPPRGAMPPGGEHDAMTPEEAEEAQQAVEAMREQLAHTPAEVVVANHCYGLFELAAIYLSQDPPMLFQARLAIDGLGAVLDALQGRLGEAEPSLRESLSQLRLVFVRLEGAEHSAGEQSSGGGPKG